MSSRMTWVSKPIQWEERSQAVFSSPLRGGSTCALMCMSHTYTYTQYIQTNKWCTLSMHGQKKINQSRMLKETEMYVLQQLHWSVTPFTSACVLREVLLGNHMQNFRKKLLPFKRTTWHLVAEHTPYTGGKGIFNAIYLKCFQKSLRPLYKSIHFTKTFIHSLPTGWPWQRPFLNSLVTMAL